MNTKRTGISFTFFLPLYSVDGFFSPRTETRVFSVVLAHTNSSAAITMSTYVGLRTADDPWVFQLNSKSFSGKMNQPSLLNAPNQNRLSLSEVKEQIIGKHIISSKS